MSIEIKKSKKPIEYSKAISFLESRIDKILNKKVRVFNEEISLKCLFCKKKCGIWPGAPSQLLSRGGWGVAVAARGALSLSLSLQFDWFSTRRRCTAGPPLS